MPEGTPVVSRMKKSNCVKFLTRNNVEYDGRSSALVLKQQVKNYIETNIPIEIERLSMEAGHKVLFTPPYHSDLQLIELV